MSLPRIQQIQEYLQETPDDPFWIYALANEYVSQGADDEAEPLFRRLINSHSDYLATYYQYAKLCERHSNTEQALILYKDGMKLAKNKTDNKTFRELSDAHQNLLYES